MELNGIQLCVPENERNVGLFQYAILYEGLPLWNGYDFSQHVGQPDRVYEVKVA